jgi:hypothetical protein
MAPEQFMDMPADPRSDVYALGLLTYRMLAGALPWSAKNVYEWAERHAREPVPPLAERAPGLPPRVYTAVHRALAKLPSERPATAGEFARELSGLTPDADPWAAIASGELALGDTQNTTRPVRAPAITVSAPPVGAAKPIQRRHLAVATVLFVAAVAIGYASVLHFAGSQRSATGPRAAPDAGAHAIATPAHADTGAAASTPDASVDTGAVHPNWPRAQRVLLDGMSRAEHHDLDASIVALSTAQDLIGPTSIKLHDLRVLASQLGAERIRDDLSHHRCADAQNVARQLRRVGAEEQTFRLFGRGCAPP